MGDTPEELVVRLSEYVDGLLKARANDKELAIKGHKRMIYNVLEELDQYPTI